ncbi:ABC transporter permease [Gluconacetobacter azotocaptans]|uniref:ABC transporter permease n=1 Tax=Gluconacetobacter azotocaptans TaxID=142834 RepID=UPI0023DB316E|nr:ABC transporter permease [Gluconacetobacter azotocaptans]
MGFAHRPRRPVPAGLRRFSRYRFAVVGLLVLLAMTVAALFGPWISPFDPDRIDVAQRYILPLSADHILGTDDLGRDVLSRLLSASRVSLLIGVSAMLMTLIVGFLVGAFAGYCGGWIDAILMRLTDMLLCFPNIFLLLFVAVFVPPSRVSLAALIGLTSWMEIARISHAQIRSLKQRDFLEAARLAGASNVRIIMRQILPNSMTPMLVAAALNTANAILLESYVSFLGYGIQPPQASWGNMLTYAQSEFAIDPWLAVFPGAAIALAVTSLNFIGEGLRDMLDVRLKN